MRLRSLVPLLWCWWWACPGAGHDVTAEVDLSRRNNSSEDVEDAGDEEDEDEGLFST